MPGVFSNVACIQCSRVSLYSPLCTQPNKCWLCPCRGNHGTCMCIRVLQRPGRLENRLYRWLNTYDTHRHTHFDSKLSKMFVRFDHPISFWASFWWQGFSWICLTLLNRRSQSDRGNWSGLRFSAAFSQTFLLCTFNEISLSLPNHPSKRKWETFS